MKDLNNSIIEENSRASESVGTIPEKHPKIIPQKVGVLVANLGTPDSTDYWAIRRYLSEFLSDRRVIDYTPWIWQIILQTVILTRRPFSSGAAYRSIWNNEKNESPLLTNVREQADKLRISLQKSFGESVVVEFCMRYGNPSTKKTIFKLKELGCNKIVFLPLYPQYSAPTTGTANDEAFRALMSFKWQPAIRTIPAYFDNPEYIKCLANSILDKYKTLNKEPDHLVVSYHGVPERYLLAGDPYHCHCQKTTRLLMEDLGWGHTKLSTTFQSKFGPGKWLGPATVDFVSELAKSGKKNVAVIAPAFSSDCIETLEEIQEEIKDSFLDSGGEEFTYIECLNSRSDHISFLHNLIVNETKGWLS
tara:strand:- start:139 stop:1224 length:1086 start_codon:yes stop_codon:yes gene_type:complete